MEIDIEVEYSKAQSEIFFETPFRRIPIHKGRRLGFTRGGAQAFVEFMVEEPGPYMWGDTINGNIDRYVTRYFMPVLKQIPQKYWGWNKQAREMNVFDSVLDFRSADKPENWEGFGYKRILLNEAGIILKNAYLWENAVEPMLLDFPDSICYIGGTPKGKNLFYDLAQKGYSKDKENEDWHTLHYSTYDNPYLLAGDIDKLASSMNDVVRQQEIYGIFVDTTEWQFIEGEIVQEATERDYHPSVYAGDSKVIGFDVGGTGSDASAMCKRYGRVVEDIRTELGWKTDQLVNWIAREIIEWEPDAVFIDYGYNPGVVDILKRLGHDVTAVNFGGKSSKSYYKNKRAEMWGDARDWLASGGAIPNNRKLRQQLTQQTYRFATKDGNCVVLTSKDEMRAEGIDSPNEADSFVVTFAYPVRKKTLADSFLQSKNVEFAESDYDIFAY